MAACALRGVTGGIASPVCGFMTLPLTATAAARDRDACIRSRAPISTVCALRHTFSDARPSHHGCKISQMYHTKLADYMRIDCSTKT